MNASGEALLEDHVRAVAHSIEYGSDVALGAIAIDKPVDAYFSRWVGVDLTGTLTLASYRLLEDLFATVGPGRPAR